MAKKSRFRELAGENDLMERTEQSYNDREDSGKFGSYIKKDIPIPQWKCVDGDHALDIIPYIASENHPNQAEGKATHNIDVWVHFGIGIQENAYVCLNKTFGRPCPICEFEAHLRKIGGYDKDYVDGFKAKRRVVYNIICWDDGQPGKGVQYWEASHYLAEKNIMAIAKNKRGGGFVNFTHPDTGKTLEFTKEGKDKGTKHVGHRFTDRLDQITEDDLDNAVELENYIEVLSYDELKEAVDSGGDPPEVGDNEENQGGGREIEREERPSSRGAGRATSRESEHKDEGRPSGRGERSTGRGRVEREEDPIKEIDEPQSEEEEKPTLRSRGRGRASTEETTEKTDPPKTGSRLVRRR